jgi:hypothetical protein
MYGIWQLQDSAYSSDATKGLRLVVSDPIHPNYIRIALSRSKSIGCLTLIVTDCIASFESINKMRLATIIGIILMVLFISRFYFMAQRSHALPVATIQRITHSILKQSEMISSLQSPQLALIQSRECQASLYTLIHLVEGGPETLDVICGIDIIALQNILYFQEKRIREFIQNTIDE